MKKQFDKLIMRVFLTFIMTILMSSTAWAATALTADITGINSNETYYLTSNIEISTKITVYGGCTANIYLNGYSITYVGDDSAPVIAVTGNSTLNLYDSYSDSTYNKSPTHTINDSYSSSSVIITGGLITGGKSSSSGSQGGIYVSGATLNMYGGTIAGNKATTGGGVTIIDSTYYPASFTMSGGTISNNYASTFGGAVYLYQNSEHGATFTMTGGAISNNTAAKSGGGVYIKNTNTTNLSSFTMSAGTISGNQTINGSLGNGGGVYITSSKFTMSGSAIISENISAQYGGGVYNSNSEFTISGGTISNNAAVQPGDGVYITSGGSMNISGSPTITQNKATSISTTEDGDGVYLPSSTYMTITGNITGGSVYFTSADNTSLDSSGDSVKFATSTASRSIADNVFSTTIEDGLLSFLSTSGSYDYSLEAINAVASVTVGSNTSSFGSIEDAIDYANTQTTSTVNLLDGVKPTETLIISKNITLYLNGYTIDGADNGSTSVFTVKSGATFNLYDTTNGTTTGTITGGKGTTVSGPGVSGGGVYVLGTFNMYGGNIGGNTVSGDGGGVYVDLGSFTMSGGNITGNSASNGGGVSSGEGSFTMSGGSITSNNASHGGGVYNGYMFTMSGGSITDNNASSNGGGVHNGYGYSFTMSAGTISSNTASGSGDGVYISATTNISGSASIDDNNGDGMYLASGKSIKITAALTGSIYVTAADGAGAKIATDGGSVLSSTANYVDNFSTSQGDIFYRLGHDALYIAKVTVDKDDFTYDLTSKNFTGLAQALSVTFDDDEDAEVTVKYNGSTDAPTTAGTYAVTASMTGATNYSDATDISLGNFIINKVTPTFSTDGTTTEYYYEDQPTFKIAFDALNGSYPTGSVSISVSATNSEGSVGEAVTIDADGVVETLFSTTLGANSYVVTYTYNSDDNYNTVSTTTDLTVNKKPVDFTVTNTEVTYEQGKEQAIVISDTGTNLTKSDFTVKYYKVSENSGGSLDDTELSSVTDAGTYLYVIDFATTQTNYTITTEYTVSGSSHLPDVDYYDNIGYFIVLSGGSTETESLKPVGFKDTFVTELEIGDTYTNELTNENDDVTVAYTSNNEDVATIDADGKVTITGAGSATITATVTDTSGNGYSPVYASYVIIVSKQNIIVTVEDKTMTYGDSVPTFTATYSDGFTLPTDDSMGTLTLATTYTAGGNVGLYSITASGLSSDDYTFTYERGTLTVAQKEIDASNFNYSYTSPKTYDGTTDVSGTVVTYSDTGVTVNYTAEAASANVGSQKVIFTITSLSGSKASNYTLGSSLTNDSSYITINANAVSFFVTDLEQTYDGSGKAATVTATDAFGNPFTDFKVKYDGDATLKSTVGDYTLTIELGSTNYTTSYESSTFEIIAADQDILMVTGTPGIVYYGDTFTLDTVGGNGTISWSSDNTAVTIDSTSGEITANTAAAGSVVTITATSTDSNYNAAFATTSFTVVAKPVVITLGNLSQTYGATSAVTATYDTVNSDTASVTVTYNGSTSVPTNAGTYAVVATPADTNYSATVYATLVIDKATIDTSTITVSQTDTTYGTALSAVTVTGADAFTKTTVYSTADGKAPTDAGDYTVTVTFTNDNYYSASKSADFAIAKKELTVSVSEHTREYATANPEIVLTYTGFITSDNVYSLDVAPTATTDATITSDVGSYDITIDTTYATDNNYTFIVEDGIGDDKFVITESKATNYFIASPVITANVGDEFTVYAYQASNLVESVTWSIDDTDVATIDQNGVVTTKTAGTFEITASFGDNYNGATATYTITVSQTEVVLVVESGLSHIYDGDAKVVTFTSPNAGFTVSTTNVTVTYKQLVGSTFVTVDTAVDAGTYFVTYTINDTTFTGTGSTLMTIEKATLSDLEVSQDGFTYGDTATAAVTTAAPTGVTVAVTYDGSTTVPTDAGTYTVTATYTGSNYETFVVTDEFTVAKAAITVTAVDTERKFGKADPTFTVTYTKADGTTLLTSTEIATIDVLPTITTNALLTSKAGDYTITATNAYDDNYSFTYVTGTLTITAATGSTLTIATPQYSAEVGDVFEAYVHVAGSIIDDADITWTVTDASGNATTLAEVDSYTGIVTATGKGTVVVKATYTGTEYDFGENATVTFTLVIGQKTAILNITNTFQTYGDTTAVTVTSATDGFTVSDTNVTVTYQKVGESLSSTDVPKDVGTYLVTATIVDTEYAGTYTAYLTISNTSIADGSITASLDNWTYGQTAETVLIDFSTTAFTESDFTVTYKYSTYNDAVPTDAGNYTVTVTLSSDNYADYVTVAEFEITKATLNVSVDDTDDALTITYGDDIPTFTLTYTTFASGDSEASLTLAPSAKVSATGILEVGTYPITISGGISSNYEFVYDDTMVLTVEQADFDENTLYILAEKSNLDVGETTTVASIYNDDIVTSKTTWVSSDASIAKIDENGTITAVASGTVTITATYTDDNFNGEKTAERTIVVDKKLIQLTFGNLSVVYNGYAQEITLTSDIIGFTPDFDGEDDDDNVIVTYTLVSTEYAAENVARNVGEYLVTYTIDDDSYYGYSEAKMYISKAEVTLTTDDKDKIYGETNPEYTFTGLLGEDAYGQLYYDDYALMFVLSSDADEDNEKADAGIYDIEMELAKGYELNSSRNYNFTIGTFGELTINQKELVVDVQDTERGYAADDIDPTYEVTGYENDEDADDIGLDVTFAYTTTVESTVDTYVDDITATATEESGNYYFTYTYVGGVAADLEITDTAVTATAGTSRSSYLLVKYSEAVDYDLGSVTYTITDEDGDDVAFTKVSVSSDGLSHYIYGSFKTAYDYELTITATANTYTITPTTLTLRPSSVSTSSGGSSGGSVVTVSKNTVEVIENETSEYGVVEIDEDIDASDVDEGDNVIFTAVGNDGYEVYAVEILDEDGNEIDYETDEDTYLFEMVEGDVTIEVTFVSDILKTLTDVNSSNWYYDAVKYVLTHGLFNGLGNGEFGPNVEMSRAMLVTVLNRMDGEPVVNYLLDFEDVDEGYWYTEAIRWAQSEGIVTGYSDGLFYTNKSITREEMVTVIYRYMNYIGFDVTVENEDILDNFSDSETINDYAIEAMTWACDAGIIQGYNNEIDPKGTATRAEVATVIMRICEMIK